MFGLRKAITILLYFTIFALHPQNYSAYGVKQEFYPIIGIDLGNTNSCISILQNYRAHIIPDTDGNYLIPSYITYNTDGSKLIGQEAKNQSITNPQNTVYSFKRLIGQQFNSQSVQNAQWRYPYKVINQKQRPAIQLDAQNQTAYFYPEEIQGMLLSKLKEIAQDYLQSDVINAIISVPTHFSDNQRQATKDSATIAGLNVLRLINEPTAAAIAYGINHKREERNIIVFDLGGSTLDISFLQLDDGVFEVMSTSGNEFLGGEDFDDRILEYLAEQVLGIYNIDIYDDKNVLQKLKLAAENAKHQLSFQSQAVIEPDFLNDLESSSIVLTRGKFEEINADLFNQIIPPLTQVLIEAEIPKSEINDVILVGGSTRIPAIRRIIQRFFEGKTLHTDINPDQAVCIGAALLAEVFIEDQKQGSCLFPIDIAPLDLGVEDEEGLMKVLIQRNSILPTKRTQIITTSDDNQAEIIIKVYQGQRPLAKDNRPLGNFTISGISPAPKGVPQIEVIFEVDESGILQISAYHMATCMGILTIERESIILSGEEIEQMMKRAEEFEEFDREVVAQLNANRQQLGES